jgi:hypothetical protein
LEAISNFTVPKTDLLVELRYLEAMTVDDIQKIEVSVKNQNAGTVKAKVTATSAGGTFDFVKIKDEKCSKDESSVTKEVEIKRKKDELLNFYIQPTQQGKILLKIEIEAENQKEEAIVKVEAKEFQVTDKQSKFFDLRSNKFDNFYISKEGVYETQINVTGNLMGDKLKSFDKLL